MILENEAYALLKRQVTKGVGQSRVYRTLLSSLKDLFKDDINSKRRFEFITTITELIRTLEDRDALSEDNVEPLKHIAQKIPNMDLVNNIISYEKSHVPRGYINYYACENTQNTSSVPHVPITASSHPYGSNKKKQRITETVIEEIGTYWRALARYLQIREIRIDEIDSNYNTIAKKASKILEIYEERADPQKGFLILCEALERARRKDLSSKLQHIMTMNI